MTAETLFGLLSRRRRADLALVTPCRSLNVGELLALADGKRQPPPNATRPALVPSDDVLDFVVSLIALDGLIDTLVCQARGQSANVGIIREELDNRSPTPGERRTSTTWVLSTSGTTGTPKRVLHTLQTITSATKLDLAGTRPLRWGLLYDPARFAGLQVVMQALLGGGVLVVPPEGTLAEKLDFLLAGGVNAVSATPSQWRSLLMLLGSREWPLEQVTLGGEIADDGVLEALKTRFPRARIVHIYASTEAGVGFAVRDGRAGFPIQYLEPGALTGVRLKIDPSGNLLIRKDRPARLVGEGSVGAIDPSGFLDTGDKVRIDADRVYFLGRSSGAINVGGNKVMPERIEQRLLEHPGIAAVRVYGRPNPMCGNVVAADVKLNPHYTTGLVRAEMTRLCSEGLQRWEIPVIVRFVDEINVGSTGKLDRTS